MKTDWTRYQETAAGIIGEINFLHVSMTLSGIIGQVLLCSDRGNRENFLLNLSDAFWHVVVVALYSGLPLRGLMVIAGAVGQVDKYQISLFALQFIYAVRNLAFSGEADTQDAKHLVESLALIIAGLIHLAVVNDCSLSTIAEERLLQELCGEE